MNSSNNSRPIRVGRILHNVRREGESLASEPVRSIGPQTTPAAAPAPGGAPPPGPKDHAAHVENAYQQGRKDGRAEAVRELSQTVQVLRNAARVYESEKSRAAGAADEQSITLALAIAKKLLGREIATGEAVRSVLRRALAQAPAHQALRARLHPEDLRAIEQSRQLLNKNGEPLPEELVLCADPSVSRGGCVLESSVGQVDARMETQLELIEQALRGLEPQGIDDGSNNRPSGSGQQA